MEIDEKRHFIGIARLIRDSERIDLFSELHRRCLKKLQVSNRKTEYPRLMSFVLCFDKNPKIKALTGQYTKTGAEKKVEQDAVTRYLKSFAVEGKDEDGKNPTKVKGYEHIPAFYAWLCFYHEISAREFHNLLSQKLIGDLPFNKARSPIFPEYFDPEKSFFFKLPDFYKPNPSIELKSKEDVLKRIEELKHDNFSSDDEKEHQRAFGLNENRLKSSLQIEGTKTPKKLGLLIPKPIDQVIWSSIEMKYSQIQTSFVGRNFELDELEQFLNYQGEKKFYWWQISGEAGQGKSRIALEIAKEFNDVWDIGFVPMFDKNFLEKIKNHRFVLPTCIIVDYASDIHRVETLVSLILGLSEKSSDLTQSLRLVVIERQPYNIDDPVQMRSHSKYSMNAWQEEILNAKITRNQLVREHLYRASSLHLNDLHTEQLLSISEDWIRSKSADSHVENSYISVGNDCAVVLSANEKKLITEFFVAQSHSSDGGTIRGMSRPLLAILVADALFHKRLDPERGMRDNYYELLKYALDHDTELMFGKKLGASLNKIYHTVGTHKQQFIASLANIVTRVERDDIIHFGGSDHDISNIKKILGYSVVQSNAAWQDNVYAREPDLIAEYQVLEFISRCKKTFNSVSFRQEIENLMSISWQLAPDRTRSFIRRVMQDFSDHPEVSQLLCLNLHFGTFDVIRLILFLDNIELAPREYIDEVCQNIVTFHSKVGSILKHDAAELFIFSKLLHESTLRKFGFCATKLETMDEFDSRTRLVLTIEYIFRSKSALTEKLELAPTFDALISVVCDLFVHHVIAKTKDDEVTSSKFIQSSKTFYSSFIDRHLPNEDIRTATNSWFHDELLSCEEVISRTPVFS